MKLIQRVKTAHSFLQSVSNQFHFIILLIIIIIIIIIIYTIIIQLVPLYYFFAYYHFIIQLAYVVLPRIVKQFFETHF